MPETQAANLWIAPAGVLGRITLEAYERADRLRRSGEDWRALAESAGKPPSFAEALRKEKVAVIAEVKKKSPSKGDINPDINVTDQAIKYVQGGASAISVLTEPQHFGGSDADLEMVAQGVNAPVLKKDFHVDAVQLYQAKVLGASAALLIVRALDPVRFRDLLQIADGIELDILTEIRDENELRIALDSGASIIGINNRNLESLAIDPATSLRLLPQIPKNVIAIAESGMRTREDVEQVAAVGADAVLIGSSVSAAGDPQAAVSDFASVPSQRNVRPH